MFYKFQSLDFQILVSPLLLSIIGLISMYSIATNNEEGQLFIKKQILFLFLGFILYIFISLYRVDFEKMAGILYMVSLILLAAVLIQGLQVHGTTAWLKFVGNWGIEPIEFVKFFLIIVTAAIINKYGMMRKIHSFIASFLILAVPLTLIITGSEFGIVSLILLAWLSMLIIYNLNFKFLLILLFISLILGSATWSMILNENQKARLTNFINPQSDIRGADYQAYQAKLAIGTGGLWGERNPNQQQLLPEAHNDFIFALTAQKWGFMGIMVLLAINFALLAKMIIPLKDFNLTTFQALTIIGIWTTFFAQAFINIGMNLGILPITGIPLPFVSYGGSSLLSSFIALGIVQNILCFNKEKSKII